MEKRRLTLGGLVFLFVASVVLLVAALRWVGSNAHTIDNGIGTVLGVVAFAFVAAAVVCGAILLARNPHLLFKRREAPAPQPAIQLQAQQLPAPGPAVPLAGLAPGQVSALLAGQAPALAPGQVPALAPGQVPGLPTSAAGPLVIFGLDHNQVGDLLRQANLAAADANDTHEESAADD